MSDSARVVAADQPDHAPGNDTAATALTIQSADLGLALAVSNPRPNEGDADTFTLTLTNHGPYGAGGIVVDARLPAGLDYKDDLPSQGSYDRPTGVWTVGNVAKGGTAMLTLTAVLSTGTGGTTLRPVDRIGASDHLDPLAANDTAGVSVSVPLADLGVSIVASDTLPNEGGTVTLTATLTNHGPDDASGVRMSGGGMLRIRWGRRS